ncbi:MAG: hypothetical protein L6R40_002279 [Gallowayella cf. fulva]|nr:MAG: hypothetical protein L6R40_002279 [Xanthomendoza cf. fulva]
MGNSSSQLGPNSPGPGPSAQNSKSNLGASGKKKGKRRDSSLDEHKDDEGSANVEFLRNGSRYRTPPPTHEDDAAAAAQLLAESSPGLEFTYPAFFDDFNNQTNSPVSQKRKKDLAKTKRRLSALEASPDGGNVQAGRILSPDIWSKDVVMGESNGAGIPPPIHSLDVVDENDEGLSSLFQEYESQAGQPSSFVDQISKNRSNSLTSFIQEYTDAAFVDLPGSSLEATNAVLDRSRKRKRQQRRLSDSDESYLGPQEPLEGTGQHAFELDFAAYDKIFANEDAHLANPLHDDSGYDIPHGTGLSLEDSLFVPQIYEDSPAELDADVIEVAPPSRRKKRRRVEVPEMLNSQPPTYSGLYAANEGQQDRVLPGLEDRQARSSSEIPYSQPPGLSHGISSTSADTQPKTTPPPRLTKPSERRGNKKQQGGQKGKNYKPPLQQLSDKGGMFRDDEIQVLDNFRDRYCEAEETSKQRFNEIIQMSIRESHEATRLFNAIYEEMPYRTRQSVLRFCRRHFHNFPARGAWTHADDERLRDAVAKKGTSWKAVGAILDRFPEDCRDRYRNYLVNSEKRNTESWTHEEIRNLVKAVDDCMRLLQEERAREKEEQYEGRDIPESEPESDQDVKDMKLINWQVVSERMGGTRSRLQCGYKFNHLKQADRDYYLKVIQRLEAGKGFRSKADSQNPESWRLRRSMRKLRNMRTGDKYDFLQLFADCNAATQSNISWNCLGSKAFRKRWSNMDMKAALELFKQEVPGSDSMNYQDVINQVYTKLMVESPNGFDDRWDPEVHGDINEREQVDSRTASQAQKSSSSGRRQIQGQENKRKKKSEYRPSARYTKIKSEALVGSDEDEEVEEDRDSEDGNQAEGSDYEKKDPTPDESVEADLTRQESVEIAESADEGDNGEGVRSRERRASGEKEHDMDSDSDSDNSLFNGDSESELVDRVQLLREA